jgi:hypothetical protein
MCVIIASNKSAMTGGFGASVRALLAVRPKMQEQLRTREFLSAPAEPPGIAVLAAKMVGDATGASP